MDTDLERRITDAVRLVADSVPVTVPPVPAVPAVPVKTPRAGWRAPLLTAAAVSLVIVAMAVILPAFGALPGPERTGAPEGGPVLPKTFAGLSLLTAGVSDSPPGPAVALYRLGALGTPFGTSQVVIVGVDGRTYRRLDLAEKRGNDGTDGEWHNADALLAPDGASVAVADPSRVRDRIEVIDLRTGRAATYRLDQAAAVDMLDWSPDGRRLVFAAFDTPMDGTERPGRLAVLDLDTGTVRRLGDLKVAQASAAFAPDGNRIAVVHTALTRSARSISVVDLAGTVVWTLPDRAPNQLTWSPDGTLLGTAYLRSGGWQLVLVDPSGRNGPVPAPVALPGESGVDGIVGWRSAGSVLVRAGADSAAIIEVPVAGGPGRPLSRLPDGPAGFGRPGEVQVAEALVADVQVRDGGVDRGPWPTWWRVTLAVAALSAGAAVVYFRRRALMRSA